MPDQLHSTIFTYIKTCFLESIHGYNSQIIQKQIIQKQRVGSKKPICHDDHWSIPPSVNILASVKSGT